MKFKYQIPTSSTVAAVAAGLGVAALFAFLAYTNEKGLRIAGFVLSPKEAALLLGAFSLLAMIAAAVALPLVLGSLAGPIDVILEEAHLVVPKASSSFKNDLIRISYAQITRVEERHIKSQQLLVIDSAAGQSRLMSSGFGSEFAFSEFKAQLRARLTSQR